MPDYTDRAKAFTSRLPAGSPDWLHDTINTAFGVSDRYAAKVGLIKADKNLSPQGMAQAIAAARNGGFGEHFGQLKKSVRDGRENTRLELSRLSLPPVDKTDAVGELRRREIRDHIRTLPMHERMSLAQNDPEVRAAVLHASPVACHRKPTPRCSIRRSKVYMGRAWQNCVYRKRPMK